MNWPNSIAAVDNGTKRYICEAFRTGTEDDDIAEVTGLDVEQVAAIRSRLL